MARTKTAAPKKRAPVDANFELVEMPPGRIETMQPLAVIDANPHTSLQLAIERGMPVETINALISAAERWDVLKEKQRMRDCEAIFVAAMAEFKSNPPEIIKRSTAYYDGNPQYNFANVGDAVAAIIPALAACGFSHRWKARQDGEKITVTCVVTHKNAPGYSDENEMTAPPDGSGKKNPLQAIASTRSYLEKYTLLGVLGLAARADDDDGRTGGGDPDETPEQKAAREKREADAVAAKAIEDSWFDKLSMCENRSDLLRTKAEMVKLYGDNDSVPPKLRSHYITRRNKLAPDSASPS